MAEKATPKDVEDQGWLPAPQRPIGCSEGLEYLLKLDEIWIKQEKAWHETSKHWVAKGKFFVLNEQKQKIYFVQEESITPDKLWGQNREFTLKAQDESGKDLIIFHRPFKKRAALFSWMNLESTGWHMEIECPKGTPLGVVKQVKSGLHKRYDVFDSEGSQVSHIKGPVIEMQLVKEDVIFDIFAPDRKSKTGEIVRKFAGGKTDSQNFLLKVPPEYPVRTKALLIGAAFLIEYMCYELTGK